MLMSERVKYHDNKTTLEAYYAYDDQYKGNRPAIIITHDWSGRNEFACRKADQLAELGYVGFALDMYGEGHVAKTKEEKSALMQPFIQDRALLLNRMFAALEAVKKIEIVDVSQIGAIGFCFGGLCVLDLARSGADIKGVVSFHGLLFPPENTAKHPIKARILALHGFDDPMVTPDQVMAFGNEMTHAKANWELTIYGQAMHAFTNPEAHDPGFGTVYNAHADARSLHAMKAFFNEIFR